MAKQKARPIEYRGQVKMQKTWKRFHSLVAFVSSVNKRQRPKPL